MTRTPVRPIANLAPPFSYVLSYRRSFSFLCHLQPMILMMSRCSGAGSNDTAVMLCGRVHIYGAAAPPLVIALLFGPGFGPCNTCRLSPHRHLPKYNIRKMPLVSCRSSSNFDSLPRSARGKNAAINRINVSSAPPSPLPNPAKSAETAEGDAELSKGERGIHGNQGSLYDFGMSQGSTLVNGGSIGAPASDGVFTTMQRSNSMLSRRGSTQSKRALKVSSAALSRRAPPVSSDSFHFVSSDLGSPASGDEQKAGIRSIHSIDYGDEDDAMRSKLRREQAMQSRASHDGTMSRRTMSLDPNNAATPLSDLFPASVDSSPTRRSQPFSIRKKAISGPSKPANGQGKQGESLSSVTSVYTGAGAAVAGQPAKKRAVNKALIGLPTNFQVSERCNILRLASI